MTLCLQVPDAEVVIVQDNDWMSILDDVRGNAICSYEGLLLMSLQNDELPIASELLSRLSARYDLVNQKG